jgi:3,4-dihydroxy 2-butanone 4-phosphate synthase/GTP cyclohydrolase II
MRNITILSSSNIPTDYGFFTFSIFKSDHSDQEEIYLAKGDLNNTNKPILVRVHSECKTGEIFHSLKCDCGSQLEKSMRMIQKEGKGLIIYLHQEGRGIGLVEKIKAYELQEEGYDTIEANEKLGHKADLRDYKVAADLLKFLDIESIRLITNNPDKVRQLEDLGIIVTERVPIEIKSNTYSKDYLKTKKNKFNHILNI